MKPSSKIIGIIGGVGPLAGLDLAAKIVANTKADKDQAHLPFILASLPELIADRTAFLLGRQTKNPAEGLIEAARRLKAAGADLVCIPCNTAHASRIFDHFELAAREMGLLVVNMLQETAAYLLSLEVRKIVVLSTLGTYECGVYRNYLRDDRMEIYDPGSELMSMVHEAIYNPDYGIKSRSDRDFSRARAIIEDILVSCREKGVELAVLGCTELPLVFEGAEACGLRLVDPATILARALINQVAPEKLS